MDGLKLVFSLINYSDFKAIKGFAFAALTVKELTVKNVIVSVIKNEKKSIQ
jgi:hypothetical protein